MKSVFATIISLIGLTTLLNSCQPKENTQPNRITVSGTITNFHDSTTVFTYDPYEFLGTTMKPEVRIHADGTYKMVIESLVPVKGFFSFGRIPKTYDFTVTLVNGKDSSMSVESADFRMVWLWLEPGDSLTMNLDADQISETLTFSGQGAVNNRFVNAEEAEFNSYKHKYLENYYHVTYRQPDDYKRVVQELQAEKLAWLNHWADSAPLSPWLVMVYHSEIMTGAITSKIYYSGRHAGFNNGQEAAMPADYYSFMDSVSIQGPIGDKGIGYYYFLNAWLHKQWELENGQAPEADSLYALALRRLPGSLPYEFMAYALARDFRKTLYDRFGDSCPYPSIAQAVKNKYKKMEGMLEGNPAPDFSLSNTEGKMISLQDLRGSFVYIDFWATWCGPCIKEIPFLKKTEEEYRDKNIRFVSISYDKASDHDKWRNYVRDNQLTGIQLIADEKMKNLYDTTFNIDLIPRFILIDPEGRIVSGNAPRPSSPRLKEMLEKILN